MLIQFTLSNFLSYREERCFSLAASAEKGHEENLISAESSGFKELQKAALLYGANASGKSNLIKGLGFLQALIALGHATQPGQRLARSAFKLDASKALEPTSFEIIFIEEGIRYAYGIALTEVAIVSEYLYHWPEGRKATIFERSGQDFKFTKQAEEQKALAGRTQATAPYLSVASNWNLDLTAPAFRWITQRLVLSVGSPLNNYQSYLNPQWRAYTASIIQNSGPEILGLLHAADFSISSLSASSRKPSDAEILPVFVAEIRETLKAGTLWDVRTSHQGVDGSGAATEVPFDLNEESLGTQRFFEMLGPWLDVLSSEKVFFMDEFDTGLHPVLSEYLLAHFLKTSKRSQFVFTTHNTNFLDSGLLRRDQVWLTEIDPKTHGTDLYSLAELGLRNDHNLEKGYLAGKYGGIPRVGRAK
jgi:uncharacterized protein